MSGIASAAPPSSVPVKRTCLPGEHWVKAYNQSAYIRSDGTPVAGSFHAAQCRENPPSYAIWAERLKDGFPPKWENKKEKLQKWSDEEKERVLEALSDLPSDLLLNSVNGIYRLVKSSDLGINSASQFERQIALYDEAFKPKQNLARILSHEFAHVVYRQLYDDNKWLPFAVAADWERVRNPLTDKFTMVPTRNEFVEEDSINTIDEDFSNSIEYFLFKPSILKAKNPQIYDWIQKTFGDKFKVGKESQR